MNSSSSRNLQVPCVREHDDARLYQLRGLGELRIVQPGVVRVGGEVRPQPFGEVLGGQQPNVIGVQRVGLLLIEAGRIELTSTTSNAATISSRLNTSRSSAIDQPSNAR